MGPVSLREVSLWPREHGAYGQLAFPLVSALAIAGPAWPAVAIAGAAVCAFLAHEPFLVVLGHRGERGRREAGSAARWRLVILVVLGGAAAATGLLAAPRAAKWALLPVLILAALVTPLTLLRRERSTLGEVAVAVTLSLFALPVALAGGASLSAASTAAALWALAFAFATLAVRSLLGRGRAGHPRPAVVRLLASFAAVGVLATTFAGGLPGVTAAPLLVLLVAGLASTVWPAPARHVRAVGWALIGLFALLLVGSTIGLRGVT